MSDEDEIETADALADEQGEEIEAPLGPGERLRLAREAKGMDLAALAAETRIPQRHLKLIEAGDFAALPARTYAVGFAKSYARAVDLDPEAIANDVRAELGAFEPEPGYRPATFEPGDPARVPGARISLIAIGAVVLLLVVGYFGYNSLFAPAAELPSLIADEEAAPDGRPAAPQPAPTGGAVVFTALEDDLWVKFYDATGAQLLQKQMMRGETYTVPADANGPLLWTGRPDALAITVGGRPIPRLSADDVVMKDVPVTAAALLARPPAPAAPASPTAPASSRPAATAPRRTTPAPPPAVVASPAAAAPAPVAEAT